MDEAELDQLGDLSIDDDNEVPVKEKGEEKVSTPKGLDIAAGEENEEVMLCSSCSNYNMPRNAVISISHVEKNDKWFDAECVGF